MESYPNINIAKILQENEAKGGGIAIFAPEHKPTSNVVPQKPSRRDAAIQEVVLQMGGANMRKTMAQFFKKVEEAKDKPTKRTTRKTSPANVVKTSSPLALRTIERKVATGKSSMECGVCGQPLTAGAVFYPVNLKDFGCSRDTQFVCMVCMERIKSHFDVR